MSPTPFILILTTAPDMETSQAIALPIARGSSEYLAWLDKETKR